MSLTLSFTGDGDDIVFEPVENSPALPRFELVEATIDDGDGEDPMIEMTVGNGGEASGTFRGAAQFHKNRPTASDWVYLPEGVEATLEPGEREALRIAASRGDDEYRVLPFGREIEL